MFPLVGNQLLSFFVKKREKVGVKLHHPRHSANEVWNKSLEIHLYAWKDFHIQDYGKKEAFDYGRIDFQWCSNLG